MSQFSRRARWLNVLFPQSKAPQLADPGSVSNDVSLVQSYDGSGWPIPGRSEWFKLADLTGVAGSVEIFRVPDDQVFRLFAAQAIQVVAPGPQVAIFVKDLQSTPNTACSLNAFLALTANNLHLPITNPIVIGPGMSITGDQFNGGAGSIVRYSIYGCPAPTGTVFAC